ncbi:holin [Mycobacterium phage Jamie19]|uniref:Holin n=13 Tax=Charlievirus TaxID=1623280 RepID=A0A142K7U9_9CAUD|nr:holin [Mycobacterium phage MichelleMyBell]YP_009197154.1 holin [Mycobacterium phage Carcharodon]YP_009616882.1 holin [Mycobacterium phage Pipsqueaks]YP_010052098.1 holin [Mycobacterium phage Andies]YP_010052165.1 holin [Mycobacterium phage Fulbright]YP_010052233.1 holin [Mycobacterium phage Rebel]YP_010052302.1 holin [Mycobacterium phage Tapioca]YP_010052369.1 holin [Mycobacterium phage Jamie19]AMS01975.1 holin [Mycobacterium phage Xerxes]AWY04111.1 holin [Mycobacterium phage Silvafight
MNSKIAQTIYVAGSVVTGIVGIALIWGGIDAGTADSINQIIGGIGVLVGGSGASTTAAVRITKQVKDGLFDKAAPADAAITAIEQTVQAATDASAEVERVKQVASDALGAVVDSAQSNLGPLAQQAVERVRLLG